MNNQKGFAPIVVVLILILLGGGTYAVVHSTVLKSYFESGSSSKEQDRTELEGKFEDGEIPTGEDKVSGDKPTESEFKDTIDSALNLTDDGLTDMTSSNLSPKDKTEFTADVAMRAIAFRWTPLVPKPKEPVTYRIKVWQLMQGQTSTEAMKTNQPIVTKDVDNITEVSVSGLYTGPCKPPFLCDFVWSVEASIGPRQTTSKVIATTPPFSFSVKEATASDDSGSGTLE